MMIDQASHPLTCLHIYGGPISIGGHYRSGLAMAKYLVREGHRVIVVAPGAVSEMEETFQQAGIELRLLPEVGKIGKLPSLSGWKNIAEITMQENVDIIHSMDSYNLARGYRAAVKTDRPFVCTEAGANSVFHFPPRKSKVIIFSNEQMEIYRDLYRLPERNLRIIRARIDSDLYYPEHVPPDFLDKYGLIRGSLTVGMACRLESSKAHKIDALMNFVKSYNQSNTPIRIYIAGDGDLRSLFQEQARQINTSNASLNFIGPVYKIQEIRRFYNFCDIVMGSGRGIMEAMACGKPVVILGENDHAELIGPDTVADAAYYNFSGRHFSVKKDSENIASVLETASHNLELLRQFSTFCSDYVSKYLVASIGAERLYDWYKKEISQSGMSDFIRWYFEAIYWKLRFSIKYRARKLFLKYRCIF